jgi:hypothetical protein
MARGGVVRPEDLFELEVNISMKLCSQTVLEHLFKNKAR